MPDFTIRGNPGAIRSRATLTAEKGTLFDDTGEALSKIDTSGWTGRAADKFRDAHDLEPDRWFKAGNGFRRAGAALLAYADAVERAQATATWAEQEYARGDRATDEYRGWFDSETNRLQNGLANGTYSSVTLPSWDDPGDAIRQNAIGELDKARAELDNAAHVCAGEVRAGCADAPEEPHWWESGLKFVGGIFQGAGEAIWDIATMLPFSPANLIQDAWKLTTGDLTVEELRKTYELDLETVEGMWNALQDDPVEFGKNLGKGLLDWDTWADDPARALGHLVPDAVVAVATAGTGTAATRGAGSIDDLVDGMRAIDRMEDAASLRHLDDLGDLNRLDDLRDLGHLDDLGGADHLDDLGGAGHLDNTGFGPDDAAAIDDYTGNNYYNDLNAHLRGLPTSGQYTASELDRLANQVSAALDRLPSYEGETLRGTNLPNSVLDGIQPGSQYSDGAFSSSSLSERVAQTFRGDGNTMFHIDGHSGHDVQGYSHYGTGEAEILFDRGTEFQVLRKEWNPDGYWDIWLRE